MHVQPPLRVILGGALALGACSKADLPLQDILHDAELVEVGSFDLDFDEYGIYAWSRDGKSLAVRTDSVRPVIWQPEAQTKLELHSLKSLGSVYGVGTGIEASSMLCLHAIDTETIELAEIQPSDGSIVRRLGTLPRNIHAAELVPSPTGEQVIAYSPDWWDEPVLIRNETAPDAPRIDLEELGVMHDMQWLADGASFACAGMRVDTCGFGGSETELPGGIGIVRGNGESAGFIYSWNRNPNHWNWRVEGLEYERLVSFPQKISVSPNGESIVYLAFTNGLQRLGKLRVPELSHARGHDIERVHDIVHLSDDVLLVSPKAKGACLEIWDAQTFEHRKDTRIPAGLELKVNHDRTRLAVIGKDQIRAYRCAWSIDGAN